MIMPFFYLLMVVSSNSICAKKSNLSCFQISTAFSNLGLNLLRSFKKISPDEYLHETILALNL